METGHTVRRKNIIRGGWVPRDGAQFQMYRTWPRTAKGGDLIFNDEDDLELLDKVHILWLAWYVMTPKLTQSPSPPRSCFSAWFFNSFRCVSRCHIELFYSYHVV